MSYEEESEGEIHEGTLYLWRVSLMASCEVPAYSREEAMYQAMQAVLKAGKELLRPFTIDRLSVLEAGKEVEPEKEPDPSQTLGTLGPVNLGAKWAEQAYEAQAHHGPENPFEPNAEAKARWIKELTEQITAEVQHRMEKEGTFTAVPIPIK